MCSTGGFALAPVSEAASTVGTGESANGVDDAAACDGGVGVNESGRRGPCIAELAADEEECEPDCGRGRGGAGEGMR